MNTLRWTLGLTTAFFRWRLPVSVSHVERFRRSFGASDNNPLLAILPLAAALLLLGGLYFRHKNLATHRRSCRCWAGGILHLTLIKEAATVMWFALFT